MHKSQLKPKSADNAVAKPHGPRPPNVIMTLIFPQGLWTTPLAIKIGMDQKLFE